MKHILLSFVAATLLIACGGSKSILEEPVEVVDRSQAPEPGPAPEIQLEEPTTFTLDNGLKVIVVENHKLPTVNAGIYFDYPTLLEGEKAGLSGFYGSVMRAGTENYSKEELDEELDFYGIDLNVNSRFIGFNSLKKQMPTALDLMKEVLFKPTFENEEELEKLKTQSVTDLEASSKNPDAIMARVSDALLYGTDHPLGEYRTEETIGNVHLSDLEDHYQKYFKPNVAYLTIVGDITVSEAKKIARDNFSDWEPADMPTFNYPTPENVNSTEINIVDLQSATQSNIYITNLEELEKANDDYFASVLGNHILGGSSFAKLFRNLREDKGYTYGAYSSIGNDEDFKSRFNAYAKVRNEVTDSAIMAFYDELNSVTTQEVSDEDLQTAKSEQTGRFALGLEDPETIARFARTIFIEDLEPDFYSNYLKSLNAQTADHVIEAMNHYIKPSQQRILIVGKAEDIAEDVKGLGYPVTYYNIWGKEVGDPTVKADVSDVSATEVITKNIDATGGAEKLNSVETMLAEYSVQIPGLPSAASATIKAMMPDKTMLIMEAEGIGQVMKQTFNGESGYAMQMGRKTEFDEEQIAKQKGKNPIFEELDLLEEELTVDNVVDVDGTSAYKVLVANEEGQPQERYYAVDSGLLLKVVEYQQVEDQTIVSATTFADYEQREGVMVPTKMGIESMGQTLNFTLDSITWNEGVTATDFD